MKRNNEEPSSSGQKRNKELHDYCSQTITVLQSKTAEVKQQSKIMTDVYGEIQLVGAPYYGLVLDDCSGVFPLIPTDSARYLPQWISSVGKRVVMSQLLAVCENFQILKDDLSKKHINFMVKWENVKILKENPVQSGNSAEKLNEVLEPEKTLNTVITIDTEGIIKSERTCRIIVHHVSIPFQVDEHKPATCLVYISYSNGNHVESKLWLVLRSEQVAWREFLIPNREYLIYFPPGIEKFFFDKFQKPLDSIMEKNIRELRVIFHHKLLFSKYGQLNGCVVPAGSKLFLTRNTSFSEYVYKFSAAWLWFKSWFSTSEADHANAPLVTFYGKVTAIIYLEEQVFQSCYLCIQKTPREPKLNMPKSTTPQAWMDPFKNRLTLGENELIEIPNVTNDENTCMETGVPGKMVQVIKLQDPLTGEERSVYTKHSYMSSCQQQVRLAPGMSVCISHLNRRCSSGGRYYYITTMFSCCRILDYDDRGGQSEGWGVYGLRQVTEDPQMKTWGVLESFDVEKVAITAKCSSCGALFSKGKCSGYCTGTQNYTTSAYAIAWINITHEDKTITKEKVIVKEDLVSRLLCIPENIWLLLKEAAAQEEIIGFGDQDVNEISAPTRLRKLFKIFCSLKTRGKFYISVKKLSSKEKEALFYCINLEPINKDRLNIVSELVMKTT